MKALSIRQPWAWLHANGYKPVENRTWSTNYRGPVLIHAAKTKPTALEWLEAMRIAQLAGVRFPSFEEMDKGGIVGVMDITGMCESHPSPFFLGPVGWLIANARPLPFLPMKGRLSLFETKLTLEGDRLVSAVP